MIVVLCERRIYSNFTVELYTHSKWCSTIYLRNKICRLVQPTSIYSPWNEKRKYLRWRRKKRNNDDDGIWAKEENILLYIYLFSSEMKGRREQHKERERKRRERRERAILYLSLSLSTKTTKKKKRKEEGFNWWTTRYKQFSVRTKENYLERIYICVLC